MTQSVEHTNTVEQSGEMIKQLHSSTIECLRDDERRGTVYARKSELDNVNDASVRPEFYAQNFDSSGTEMAIADTVFAMGVGAEKALESSLAADVVNVSAKEAENLLAKGEGVEVTTVITAGDRLAYLIGNDSRVLAINGDTAKFLGNEKRPTGTYQPKEGDHILIADKDIAMQLRRSSETSELDDILGSLQEKEIPHIDISFTPDEVAKMKSEYDSYHNNIKSRMKRPARKSSAASAVPAVGKEVELYSSQEGILEPDEILDPEEVENRGMDDILVTTIDLPVSTSTEMELYHSKELELASGVQSPNSSESEVLATDSYKPTGKRLRTAYEVAEDRYQNDKAEAFANAKAPAVYLGPDMYHGPQDEPELREELAAKERGFTITDRRIKLYNQEVTHIKLTENGVDLDVDRTEPATEVLDVVDTPDDRAVAGAERKLAAIRQQIDSVRDETRFSRDKQLAGLTKEYLEQNARLRSLKDNRPYTGKHMEAPEVRSLSKRAQEMYTRAGVDLSTQLFMLNERLPRPQQRKNETDAAYEARVEKYRRRVIGAGVLAVYGFTAAATSASFTGVEVTAAPLTTGRRI